MKKLFVQMTPVALGLLLLAILWNCREKTVENERPAVVTQPPKPAPELPKELWVFTGLEDGNTDHFEYKLLGAEGPVRESDLETNLKVYKDITKGRMTDDLPIFELKDHSHAVLLAGGKGFVAGIWAYILVDLDTGIVQKVQFGHRAETEGYGAGITADRFESHFGDLKITAIPPYYGLTMGGNEIVKGTKMVDGVSGATISSLAAISLMNTAIERFHAGWNSQ